MYQYAAFGLALHTSFPMPELLESDGPPDVIVRQERIAADLPVPSGTEPSVRVSGDEVLLFWKEVGYALVRGGREILVDPVPGVTPRLLRHIVQGVAMGVLLHQRGVFTLHASAVAIGGGVAAFVGWKGWGKSTTTAALHARGHPVVTDDLLVLDTGSSPEEIRVSPGVPQLKLWPEALACLGEDPEALPRFYAPSPKRVRSVAEGFQAAPLPLRGIYLLDYAADEETPGIELLPPFERFVTLLTHSYPLRFLDEHGATPEHLRQCTYVAQQVPVCRLKRARALDRLSEVLPLIEADVLLRPAPSAEIASTPYAPDVAA